MEKKKKGTAQEKPSKKNVAIKELSDDPYNLKQ